jgi:subtilase family serine protease
MAPVEAPQFPANLAPWIESIHGLNAFENPKPMYQVNPDVTAAVITPTVMRAAYNSTGVLASGATGSAHEIGLSEMCDPGETTTGYQTDVSDFDSHFGLTAATLTFTDTGATSCTSGSSGWSIETDLDMEWAHTMAPGATIDVCLDNTDPSVCDSDFVSAGIVLGSNSWGGGGPYHSIWTSAEAAGVTLLASAGDDDAAVNYPAAEPDGLGVGGTSLTASASGYGSETVWQTTAGSEGTGGGCDTADAPPSYQIGMTGYPGACGTTSDRGDPDVAADADPATGVTVFYGGSGSSETVGGTSLACPMWAASLDIIYQFSGFTGFSAGQLYTMAKSTSYNSYFHDITTGTNGYAATVGWDPATGVGSPNIGNLAAGFMSPLAGTLSPLTANVEAGTSVIFNVTASGGTTPYTYQWELNSTAISGATAATYTFVPAHPATYTISVVITDSATHTDTAGPATVTVTPGPSVTLVYSPSGSIEEGMTVTLTAAASGGTGTYTQYSWLSNGSSFATTAVNTENWVAPNAIATYTLGVEVTDSAGGRGSASVAITIVAGPSAQLSASPSGMVDEGTTVHLTATASGGSGSFNKYSWTQNGAYLANTTTSTYNWVAPMSVATFTLGVRVYDTVGGSGVATLAITTAPAPTVTLSPASSQTIDLPSTVKLTAVVTNGVAPFTYLFLVNGTTILSNSTASTYTWTPPGAATYNVTAHVIDSLGGTATSAATMITVHAHTGAALSGPNPDAVDVGQSATLSVHVSGGTAPYTYKWVVNGGPISANKSTYQYTASSPGSVSFYVTVKDGRNQSVSSSTATLTVNAMPTISISGNANVTVNTTDNLTAIASGGTAPLTYVWTVNDVSQGVGGPTLMLSEPTPDLYSVYVTVTDSVGESGQSSVFVVNVTAPAVQTTPPWYETSPIPGITGFLGWLVIIVLIVAVIAVVAVAVHHRRSAKKSSTPGIVCGTCGAGPFTWGVPYCNSCGTPFGNVVPMEGSSNYVAYPSTPAAMPPWPPQV